MSAVTIVSASFGRLYSFRLSWAFVYMYAQASA